MANTLDVYMLLFLPHQLILCRILNILCGLNSKEHKKIVPSINHSMASMASMKIEKLNAFFCSHLSQSHLI